MANEPDDVDNDRSEDIVVRGAELVERIKSIVQEGNVRRLVISRPDGEALLEIPLTVGVVAGGGLVLIAPVLAALGAVAALLAEVKVRIIRDGGDDEPGNQ
jgi:hypothetical protein